MLTNMRKALMATICCMPVLALAADFDGSRILMCATMESHDCSAGEICERGMPQTMGVPTFMRVDVSKKTIEGTKRTTPIASVSKGERQLLLQGSEGAYGWTLVLDTQDGAMTGTLVSRDGVFALFGACTPL